MLTDITGNYENELYVGKYSDSDDGYGLFSVEYVEKDEDKYLFLTEEEFNKALNQFKIFKPSHFTIYGDDEFE
ncbi:hypothetical protein FD31_GL000996 [Companilactobacillus nantensis DSM 16982]|uniref:Uncharacterized protein n=2 Tax=Companilactobacillus nantensis TaxID=305793 RepID=A0A0R1WL91_9LACO|nr:hypothetical protein FD31_GL000996 [Companilactobacillus nantensis DSM 16982]